ncbi:MAG: nucleoside diphosphate kinase regulator [Rhodanobacteraceae bacterium]
MRKRDMNNNTSIILSRLDVERIERLLETSALRDSPAAARLRAEFDRGEIVEPAAMPHDVVSMNSSADCADETSGKHYTLTLVYPKDADADAGRVSILAPVGSALLGLRGGARHRLAGPGRPHTETQGHRDPLPAGSGRGFVPLIS